MVWYIRFLKTPKINQHGHVRALITVTTDLGDEFYPIDLTLYATITGENNWTSEWRTVEWKSGMRNLWIDIGSVDADPPVDSRLVVNSKPNNEGNSISMEGIPEILAVWSDTFDKGKSQAGSMIERRYRTPSGFERTTVEETGESIARHIWDAGIVLVAFLNALVLQTRPKSGLTQLLKRSGPQGLGVLELGSGCGIAGLQVTGLCSGSNVLLTDLPDAMDILKRNVEVTRPVSSSGKLAAAVLNWDEPLPDSIAKQRFDLVILSDCTYNSDSIPGLVTTLGSVAEVWPDALYVISLKVRHESEAIFFDLMANIGFIKAEHTLIPLPDRCRSETGQDLEAVEIYVYRSRRSIAER